MYFNRRAFLHTNIDCVLTVWLKLNVDFKNGIGNVMYFNRRAFLHTNIDCVFTWYNVQDNACLARH